MCGISTELKRLYDEDQRDRIEKLYEKDPARFDERDKERLTRVKQLIAEDKIVTAADHLHAAMIFQHSGKLKHYQLAHKLAKKAAEMGYEPEAREAHPRWLAAAALDRALMTEGKPQHFGTQFRRNLETGRWYLYEVDSTVTDEERAEWHVPPLARAHARADQLNRENQKNKTGS